MEKFNAIISKRIKLRSWLIGGCIFIGIAMLFLLVSIPFMMKYKCEFIVIITWSVLGALGFIPFFLCRSSG